MGRMEWVGPDEAEPLSAMARDILFRFYDFVDPDSLARFYLENLTPESIRNHMAEGCVYGYITDGNQRTGYASYRIEGESAFLSKFYLCESSRGKGTGSEALDEILKISAAAGASEMYLHVNSENKGAIRFYGRKGFSVTEEFERYGSRISVMVRKLTPEVSPSTPL